ncbi:MAG: TonB-dependent receptor plug domain-containing protein [Vicinamibacterales bacterium]
MKSHRFFDTFSSHGVGRPTSSRACAGRNRRWLAPFLALASCLGPSPLAAQSRATDLAQASLEDLMKIEITSASRKEQRLSDTPAAVFVITQDDIRRSGVMTIPGLLRMVPGVQVAEINGNNWAISARGFNDLYSNKLLVMVDGRTIYNPTFAGVFWDIEEVMLEDVERIEVIRGPGGAVWGANAVNGVINIITRSASATQGVTMRVGGVTTGGADAAVRYGGTFGSGSYRVFSQGTHKGTFDAPNGPRVDDGVDSVTGGVRMDWPTVLVEGGFTSGARGALWLDLQHQPLVPILQTSQSRTGHVLVRWTHELGGGASLQLQAFSDNITRAEPVVQYSRHTSDVDVAYHVRAGRRHDVVAGGGYRHIDEAFGGDSGYAFDPGAQHEHLVNAFVQDEIGLTADRRLSATLGAKMEHGVLVGGSVQPTARMSWRLTPDTQHLWAAASRAIRTPSLLERGLHVTIPYPVDPRSLPVFYEVLGDPAIGNESVIDLETGYRYNFRSVAAFDVTFFTAKYDGLRTREPLDPTVVLTPSPHVMTGAVFGSLLGADTRGVEAAAHWQPVGAWRLDGTYSLFSVTPRVDAASHDPNAPLTDGNAPARQWRLHSGLTLGRGVQFDASVRHASSLVALAVPAYTAADVRVEWNVTRQLSIAAVGQNIFDKGHLEYSGNGDNTLAVPVPRSLAVQMRWAY